VILSHLVSSTLSIWTGREIPPKASVQGASIGESVDETLLHDLVVAAGFSMSANCVDVTKSI
jgi:hypothetical protein